MYQNEFSIILPSNSSEKYFPDNTTTNFSTRLPREVELSGSWVVGISEILIPCTILHINKKDSNIAAYEDEPHYFPHGMYDSIQNLIQSINDAFYKYNGNKQCYKLVYNEKGGYVSLRDFLPTEERTKNCKIAVVRGITERIIGFDTSTQSLVPEEEKKWDGEFMIVGDQPASLARAVPDQLFIYSNICEHSIVGDTHAPLLRIVDFPANEYHFGTTIVKKFSSVHYVPLPTNRFQTVYI